MKKIECEGVGDNDGFFELEVKARLYGDFTPTEKDHRMHGILNMPPEIWGDSEIEKMQRYSTYMRASRRIEELERALNDLLSDCINFDGGKLTDSILESACKVLKEGS